MGDGWIKGTCNLPNRFLRIDGHSIEDITKALDIAKKYETAPGRPRVIIADTVKGKPISFMMKDAINWHAGHLDEALYKSCMKELEYE